MEDLLVGALPWSAEHAIDAPTNNTHCEHECFFPQRPADHPLLFDRFAQIKDRRGLPLDGAVRTILSENDWYWVVTGVHAGGGVDASLIIRKDGSAAWHGTGWNWWHIVGVSLVILLSLLTTKKCQRRRYERVPTTD